MRVVLGSICSMTVASAATITVPRMQPDIHYGQVSAPAMARDKDNRAMALGSRSIPAGNMAPGIYLMKLGANGVRQLRRVMLVP